MTGHNLPGWRMANRWAVPGTGNRRHLGHYFRAPHNANIKRAILCASGSLTGEKVPPSNYDDIHIAALYDRNWKRFRLHRWKDTAHA